MSGETPDWVTLTEGEEVVWTGHPSLVTEIGSILLGAVLIAVGTAVAVGIDPISGLPVPPVPVGGAIALLGLLSAVAAYVRTRVTAYVLTTEEAYEKHGLLSRTVTNVRLDRVNGLVTEQLDRLARRRETREN